MANLRRSPRNAYLCLVLGLVLAGVVYVGNAWSPSSYALALRYFDVAETGLVAGTPRDVRADEWAVFTPQLQAAVNNDFQRYNTTSYYREDLRWIYALPLRDWGMAFKPTLWGYFLLDPALAYSLHHYLLFAAFLGGYVLLFLRLGAPWPHALALSGLLLFSAYVQTWWTALAPTFAFFPWLLLLARAAADRPALLVPLYWAGTAWALAFFYPPLLISLALVGVGLLWYLHPAPMPRRWPIGLILAGVAAAATVGVYLFDYLAATWPTHYPGQRLTSGGAVTWQVWMSQFMPSLWIGPGYAPLISDNVCAIASAGNWYLVAALCLLDYASLAQRLRGARLLAFVPLAMGLVAMWAWMLLPLPGWLGAPLLFNRIPPERMEFAAGLAFLCLVYLAIRAGGIRATWLRMVAFGVVMLAIRLAAHGVATTPSLGREAVNLGMVPVVWLLFAVHRFLPRRLDGARLHTLVLAAAAGWSALVFAGYNPIQSARPIFHRPATPVTAELDRLVAEHPIDGRPGLAVPGFFGAVLNGWGYPALSHVLPTPQLAVWRRLLPDLSEQERDLLFNRYAHISLDPMRFAPHMLRFDGVALPLTAVSDGQVYFPRRLAELRAGDPMGPPAGYVDRIVTERGTDRLVLRIEGWAPFDGWAADQTIHVAATPRPASMRYVLTRERFDVANLLGPAKRMSGFVLELAFAGPDVDPAALRLCLATRDQGVLHPLNAGTALPWAKPCTEPG